MPATIVPLPGLIDADHAAKVITAQATDPVAAGAVAGGLRETLLGNELFQAVAMPRRTTGFAVRRHASATPYEFPLEGVVKAGGELVRADLAVTVFLSDPAAYAGGELSVATSSGTERLRLAAGDAVVYPTTNYRRLAPVTEGEQWLADAAIESLIRDPDRRQILIEMWQTLDWLAGVRERDAATIDQAIRPLERARANLFKEWAET